MAEKDYEGQEESGSGGGGSKPNVANLGSLPVFGKSAKAVKGAKRASKVVRGRSMKVAPKGSSVKKAYKAPSKGGKGGKGKP